jgi:hypothetical protein
MMVASQKVKSFMTKRDKAFLTRKTLFLCLLKSTFLGGFFLTPTNNYVNIYTSSKGNFG